MSLDAVVFNRALDDCVRKRMLDEIEKRGEQSEIKYVRRWAIRGGIAVVTEQTQPNVWISKRIVEAFPDLSKLGIDIEEKDASFRTGKSSPGRNSNVHSSPGFGDIDLIKFRVQTVNELLSILAVLCSERWSPLAPSISSM